MANIRWDETWHRLHEWTNGQAPSERLAAQLLLAEGYTSVDPSHPLGGRDGVKDALCVKAAQKWVMAVYFPRGPQSFKSVKKKLIGDLAGVHTNGAHGLAFVTNQEFTLGQRAQLSKVASPVALDLFHLERVTALLDDVRNAALRKQFLGIDYLETEAAEQTAKFQQALLDGQQRIVAAQTGGDSFCYFMLYNFDLPTSIAREVVLVKEGEFSVLDITLRVCDMDRSVDVFRHSWGNLNAPASSLGGSWKLPADAYYRIFFNARNGSWHQDLILRRSEASRCWLAATRVLGRNGRDVVFTHLDSEYEVAFGPPEWRS